MSEIHPDGGESAGLTITNEQVLADPGLWGKYRDERVTAVKAGKPVWMLRSAYTEDPGSSRPSPVYDYYEGGNLLGYVEGTEDEGFVAYVPSAESGPLQQHFKSEPLGNLSLAQRSLADHVRGRAESPEERETKPLIEPADFAILGESFVRLSGLLSGHETPIKHMSGYSKDMATGIVYFRAAPEGEALPIMKALIELRDLDLRGRTRAISRANVTQGSSLGGTALTELHERTASVVLPHNLATGVAGAVGGMHQNIEEAMDDATGSAQIAAILEETGQLIHSRLGGTPNRRKREWVFPRYGEDA